MIASSGLGAGLGLVAGGGLLLVMLALLAPRVPLRARRAGALGQQAGLPGATPSRIGAVSALAGLIGGALALAVTALPVAALLAAALAATVPTWALRRRAAARRRALRAGWPDAVDMLVSAVRSGMSLPEATSELARTGPDPLRAGFRVFADEYRVRGSFLDALDVLRDELADPVADRVVAALRLAREVGGTDLGVTLRTLSAMLREDARLRGEITARQSWTVAAARMAVAAPWLTLALLCTRPEAVAAFTGAAGAAVLTLVAFLSVAAYLLSRRIGRLPADERLAA